MQALVNCIAKLPFKICVRYSKVHVSPTLNGSLAIWHFKCSDAIKLHDGIIFDFYMGLLHMQMNKSYSCLFRGGGVGGPCPYKNLCCWLLITGIKYLPFSSKAIEITQHNYIAQLAAASNLTSNVFACFNQCMC